MRRNRVLLISFTVLLGVVSLWAKDFWDEPFEKWNRNQVSRIMTDSPWAQSQTLSYALGGKDAGIQGEKEIFHKLTVRFFSARPIREAYVRMFQILNNYDQMSPEQRQDFAARFGRGLNLDVSDRVIIAVEFATNDPQTNRNLKQFLDTAQAESLKQDVYLITRRLGRVQLREYFPPSPDGTGAKFIFPRQVNNVAVIQPQDDEARFEFYVSEVEHKFLVNFKVKRLFYHGELSY